MKVIQGLSTSEYATLLTDKFLTENFVSDGCTVPAVVFLLSQFSVDCLNAELSQVYWNAIVETWKGITVISVHLPARQITRIGQFLQ